ncbi:MAG: hypothetical protein ACLQPV_03075 [Vulcanimicrobiaceae bacterium]
MNSDSTGRGESAAEIAPAPLSESHVDEEMASTFDFGLVLAFGIIFLALCALFAVSMHRSQSPIVPVAQITFAPFQPATPSPPAQALRGEAVSYWKPAIARAGVADAAFRAAQSDFAAGAPATALRDIATGQQAAQSAFESAAADPPEDEDWSTIQSDLVDGESIERDAFVKAKTAVQGDSQMEFGGAVDAANNARKAIALATRDARAWYAAHGGNPAAIRGIDGTPPATHPNR